MCYLCNNIQAHLTEIKKYDKNKEVTRQELYYKFDKRDYVFDREDYLKLIDLFSFSQVKSHQAVIKDATSLYFNGKCDYERKLVK
ncbi:hypothetical protein D3C74_468050 [compost metagenome]